MLYGLSQLNNDATHCYDCGYFGNHGQEAPFSELILEAIKLLNTEIRPQAVSIIESLKIKDNELHSAVGNSYGDIYETHLEWARNSRMNQTKLGDAIPDGYMEHIMPILNAKM